MLRRLILAALLAAVAGVLVFAYAYAEALRDPVVRRADIALPDWPKGAKPVRVVLISDIHIGSPAMDARRLGRIVTQIDALKPDLVVIAGDFIFGNEWKSAARIGAPMVAPLSRLRAPLGVVAVGGNHDFVTGIEAVGDQLRRAGVIFLDNQAIVRGPLAIAGISDGSTLHSRTVPTVEAMRKLPGARIALTHSPDSAPEMPLDVTLMLTGHTHCGQVVLPWYGPLAEVSKYRERFRCGDVHDGGRRIIVTAGLGTSGVPFRLNAPPDLWLLTLGPEPESRR